MATKKNSQKMNCLSNEKGIKTRSRIKQNFNYDNQTSFVFKYFRYLF